MTKAKAAQIAQQRTRFVHRAAAVVDSSHEMAMEVDVARHRPMLVPMPNEVDPFQLVRSHRVLVVAGAGGVGKTTMSAAFAALAASVGKRVLCLTIDPARRLAQAFGVSASVGKEAEISSHVFRNAALSTEPGQLTLMMLDPRETFDEVVQAGLSNEDVAQRVLSHKVYDHLAKNLAGTQSYMAMEKVCAVAHDPRWDLVVLDTPPSARVLDFFDAPSKMAEILDSPATRALVTALRSGEHLRPGLVGVGMRAALSGMQRVTGSTLLSDVAELVAAMNQLLGGFGRRAARLQQEMTSPDFGYVLVTSPDATVVSDVSELARAMADRQLKLDALVCNRVARGVRCSDWGDDSISALRDAAHRMGLDHGLVERSLVAASHEKRRHAHQLSLCERLEASLVASGCRPAVSYVSELDPDQGRSDVWLFAQLLRDGFATRP